MATTDKTTLNAKEFITQLEAYRSDEELKKYERYFPLDVRGDDKFIGIRMGQVFSLAKEFIDMPVGEIETLMESQIHEIRAGAMSIMGKSASRKNVTPERLKELYDLYIKRHDRINNWDLVDLAAYYVVGKYLADKPHDILYDLARSQNPWERRTAILSTFHFMRYNKNVSDTLAIAELLQGDHNELVQKAVGWMLRFAYDTNNELFIAFLDKYAATMPRITLRYAVEHLDKERRTHYLNLGKTRSS
jgi:3-methyladenine DNA glycosylase AlkD